MKRSFELLDGKSAKFWEIVLEGNEHTVRYGKLGSKGTTKTKSFADAAAAKKDADKLIKAKTKKGYAEVAQAPAGAGSSAIDATALEAELAKLDADPSPEARLVFGDWLQSVGHPWGKLISLDAAGEADERDALLAANSGLLGALARRGEQTRFVWRQGFIDEATIIADGNAKVVQQCLQPLFSLDLARYLRRLVLDGDPQRLTTYQDWDDSRENMVSPFGPVALRELSSAPASLRELSFGVTPPRGASAYVSVPKLELVAKHLPELEVLEVQCSGDEAFAPLSFAKLRRLEMRFANAGEEDLRMLRESTLPALEELSVWLGGTSHCILDDVYYPDELDYDDEDDDYDDVMRYPASYPSSDLEAMNVYSTNSDIGSGALAALCSADWAPSLTRLGLQSASLGNDHLIALFTSKLVARLTHLDLSGGTLAGKQVKTLLRHAKHLEHLEHLDLRRNFLSAKQVAAVSAALPNADCSDQRKGQSAPEFLFRYVATME